MTKNSTPDIAPPLNVSRPLIILILVELLTSAFLVLWESVSATHDHDARYLLFAMPVVCLEGLYSSHLTRLQNNHRMGLWKFRVVELIGLGLFIKLSAVLTSGDIGANLLLLDLRTGLGGIMGLALWRIMLATAHDFSELDAPPEPAVMIEQKDYVSPLTRLTNRFLVGGIMLFGAVGLMTALSQSVALLVPIILVYLVIGLVALPGLRFQMSRREWLSLGIHTTNEIAVSWLRSGLVLVVLAVIVAILLPTTYFLGLLEFLRSMVSILFLMVIFIGQVLLWLGASLVHTLFGSSEEQIVPPPQLPQMPPLVNQATPASNQLLELLPKIGLLLLVIYIVVSYFRDNPQLWAAVKRLQLFQFLANVWETLQHNIRTFGKGLRLRIPTSLSVRFGNRSSGKSPFKFVRLNSFSPRERVYYFYLTTLRRAQEIGIPRTAAQTPSEFSDVLKSKLIERQEDVDHLTEAFIEARYSRQTVEPAQAASVQIISQRVRQALRLLKTSNKTSK